MRRSLLNRPMILSLALLAFALWQQNALPAAGTLDAQLLAEPRQTATSRAPFDAKVNGVDYHIKPLYDYDIRGLVVSKHNADTWWDYLHRETNDHLNITDLCVVWGNNVRNHAYQAMTFSSLQFTCFAKTDSAAAYAAFDPTALSNNHLLTDQTDVAEALRSIQIGDQIRITGWLSEYSHQHGFAFHRGTSTVRTDTGNGACETIFVHRVERIKDGDRFWRALVWVSAVLVLIGVAAWFTRPLQSIHWE